MGHTSQRRLLVITNFFLYFLLHVLDKNPFQSVLTVVNNHQKLLRWFAQLALAVDYLHSNYVLHRDLKVSGNNNVFFHLDHQADSNLRCSCPFCSAQTYFSQKIMTFVLVSVSY
jgi:serine/threonine protein kinase